MGSFNIAGPWIFDAAQGPPAVDLAAWELTDRGRVRHKPTGCEFRMTLTVDGVFETRLRFGNRWRMPPLDQLAGLAQAAMVAGSELLCERAASNACDAQNAADRLPGWMGR